MIVVPLGGMDVFANAIKELGIGDSHGWSVDSMDP
jgi:hypothetical protein